MKIKNLVLFFIIIGVLVTYLFHKEKFTIPVTKTKILMDTVVTITIYGKDKNYLEDLIDIAFEKMMKLENMLNNYNPKSEISKINTNAGIKPVKVSDTTIKFLEKSIKLCKKTNGYLDITIGRILALWGFANKHPKLPNKKEIEIALKLKGIKHIKINKQDKTVYIDKKDINIDVGAVAKGFIIDKIIEFLSTKVSKGVVNAGGDIRFIGYKDKNLKWKVGIRNPFSNKENDIFRVIEVGDWSVVTSGDYERYFIENGKKYHHIINPFTGFPSRKAHSVTVCANSAFIADGLATAIFVMGKDLFYTKFYKKFANIPHLRIIIIESRKETFDSNNFKSPTPSTHTTN